LSQDWKGFDGISFMDLISNRGADPIRSTMPAFTSVELYQELAPLAGSMLQSMATQIDHVSLQSGSEMWTSGHEYHGPAKWLSEDDAFNHFVYDVNGHFIP
jgi:hypothetical protein